MSVCVIVTLVAGCGAANESAKTVSEEKVGTQESETTTTEIQEEIASEKEKKRTEVEPVELDRTPVQQLVSNMNAGWNLGNTFDAHGAGNTIDVETYWGNPKTTKEMIDAVAAQGFHTIRIPVTWAEHLGEAPDYQIDPEWMERVNEVVDYALENDMYVMLNTHHEPDYWLVPNPDTQEQVVAEFTAVWKQIAEQFKTYDEHLVFEGMNEVRTKGSEKEWNGGTPEERVVINALNKAFVDTVRSTGGQNETRCLIISTYGNSPSYKALKELEIPQDANIAVAVHMYTPYLFTYAADANQYSIWDGKKKDEIVVTLREIDKYILKQGVPVLVTEFGAENKDNSSEIIKWIDDYLDAMNKYDIPCIWWDNGNYEDKSGERFAIFNRDTCTWYDQAIADELVKKGNN